MNYLHMTVRLRRIPSLQYSKPQHQRKLGTNARDGISGALLQLESLHRLMVKLLLRRSGGLAGKAVTSW
jgi:hypothetical protein